LFSVSGSFGRIGASKFRHFATTHLIDRTLPDIRRGITSKKACSMAVAAESWQTAAVCRYCDL
jgi:hypothetical protein